ncbi:uncharacterized protein LOC130622635 isoform X2 [Hydractinia symbiolongicarpus]|uniref:uncharacterized protein LOC130622635 isoform X2 n=1 Tax=Hydractinia symbiolongicarpus TaxID=13093 RepID=UPI00254CDADA|nr:uncharacterized protein LOC130622635 isoform X2 [Hydractinia symbiolongicarpus]
MSKNNDETLLTLMSMGFEYAECKTVLQDGLKDVEEAIQRLLCKKGGSKEENYEVNDVLNGSRNSLDEACPTSYDVVENEKIKSRYELSDKHHQQKEQFNKKYRDAIDQSAKKQRLEERKLKQDILNKIKLDRQSKVEKRLVMSSATQPVLKERGNKDEVPVKSDCKIQIRLPSGATLQASFDRHCLLKSVMKYVTNHVDISNVLQNPSLMQPFPRREFTEKDMGKTLNDLSLYPSAMLVVHEQCQPSIDMQEHEGGDCLEGHIDASDKGLNNQACANSRILQGRFINNVEDNISHCNDQSKKHGHHSDSFLFQQAVEKRLRHTGSPEDIVNISRDIPQLQQLAAKCAACHLLQLHPNVVNSMARLSSKSATTIMTYLKSKKKLTPNVMNFFLPCKLQEINLDFYMLTTNDLLERMRWHYNISKMSLKSCACITDTGLSTALTGLHSLQYLNLTECTQLTGRILDHIAELTKLRVLIMDRTKVKDKNVQQFFKTTKSQSLTELSFNYCSIGSDAFHDVPECPSLVVLSVNHTKVSRLDFITQFNNLRMLGIKSTSVTDDQTVLLEGLTGLFSLELQGTPVTNEGLPSIKGLKLTHLSLPDRQMVDDVTISIIAGCPLNSLDLGGYIKLTGRCLYSISQMKSLKDLSLSNTKITDNGIELLCGLDRLEALDLSRTSISNRISVVLIALPLLETLNLSWTKVDDDVVEHLNSCCNLMKLNLAHTGITNKGIARLVLHYLNVLLLDWTEVTLEGIQQCLENCCRLMTVRNSKYKVSFTKNG